MYSLLLCCVFISLMFFVPAANSQFLRSQFFSVRYFESGVWVQSLCFGRQSEGKIFRFIYRPPSPSWSQHHLKNTTHNSSCGWISFGFSLSHWSQGIHCVAVGQKLVWTRLTQRVKVHAGRHSVRWDEQCLVVLEKFAFPKMKTILSVNVV